MSYFDRPFSKARTIETLEISDVMEIVARDMARYNAPDEEAVRLITKYVIPMKKESDEIKLKYRK